MSQRIAVPKDKVPARGMRTLLRAAGKSLAVFNIEGLLYAIDDSCPHQGASLSGGRLEGRVIQCCAHGLRFDVVSGYLVNSTSFKVANYPVEMEGEHVFIIIDPEECAV